MQVVKTGLTFAIALIQLFIGVSWFVAFFTDQLDQAVPQLHPSVFYLFGIILILGVINLFIGIINLMQALFKSQLKIQSGFSIALLTVILTIILLLMLRYALSLG